MLAYCSDKYKVKAINIVLSHSSQDKELLEKNPEKKDKYVMDFFKNVKTEASILIILVDNDGTY